MQAAQFSQQMPMNLTATDLRLQLLQNQQMSGLVHPSQTAQMFQAASQLNLEAQLSEAFRQVPRDQTRLFSQQLKDGTALPTTAVCV